MWPIHFRPLIWNWLHRMANQTNRMRTMMVQNRMLHDNWLRKVKRENKNIKFCFSWKSIIKNWPVASQPLTLLFLCLSIWILCRILLPEYTTVSSVPMRMAILFIGAQICGVFLRLLNLPEMLGMLGFGIFFTNMGWGDFTPYQPLESIFR